MAGRTRFGRQSIRSSAAAAIRAKSRAGAKDRSQRSCPRDGIFSEISIHRQKYLVDVESLNRFFVMSNDQVLCIYCGRLKPRSEFSLEHIWPDKAGGNLLPAAIFHTEKVCERCNNISGLYIDGPF